MVQLSCNRNNNDNKKSFVKDNKLIKEEYYSNKIIKYKQYFSIDGFPNGSSIDYYPSGIIEKWKWFNKSKKYPYGIVYYDKEGHFLRFKGTAFINAYKLSNTETAIEIINPQNTTLIFSYKDIKDGKVKRDDLYEPSKTDSTSWVTIDGHVYDYSHKYILTVYFLDNKNNKIDSSFRELLN